MHQTRIPLDIFVNTADLADKAKFTSPDVLDYLGKSLERWLGQVLTDLGVHHEPVVNGVVSNGAHIKGPVYIAAGAVVEPTAMIVGPCYVGPNAEVRHGAYIRGYVYVGARAVVGHATEVKGSVFCDEARAGHFAYVGDSFLGRDVNLGAGTKLANLKLKGDEVSFIDPVRQQRTNSGLRKFGSVLGDHAQTGCNAVLSPGTLMLPYATVLPCAHERGLILSGRRSQK